MSSPDISEELERATSEVVGNFGEIYRDYGYDLCLLRLLAAKGFQPEAVYDVGGSNGVWSAMAASVYPGARYELFEPLAEIDSRYRAERTEIPAVRRLFNSGRARMHPVALGKRTGKCRMTVYPHAVGSTSIKVDHLPPGAKLVEVPQWSMDEYIASRKLPRPSLLKLDTQGAELEILRGATNTLEGVVAVFCECWLFRGYGASTPLWIEVAEFLAARDLHLFDTGWEYRRPTDQRTATVDMLFVRRDAAFSPLRNYEPGEVLSCQRRIPPSNSAPKPMPVNYFALKSQLADLRSNLSLLLSSNSAVVLPEQDEPAARPGSPEKDLLITPNEINWHHGTGVLLSRLFDPSHAHNIRSRENYPDKGPFTSFTIAAQGRTRSDVFAMVADYVRRNPVRRILCVPYYPEDYLIGIAAKSILGAPLAVWVMDDVVVHFGRVSKDLASELFGLADIRFVISPEMRDAYESKFQQKFTMLPPTVNADMIENAPAPAFQDNLNGRVCAMVGNIWGRTWFRSLLSMVKESGWTVHWFRKESAAGRLETSPGELAEHNIVEKGFVPESELPAILAAYPFSILPTGSGGDDDDQKGITLLSLPTKMPLLLAAARIPMLVVGNTASCASRFLERFGAGLSAPYKQRDFADAVAKLCEPGFNAKCRANAASAAGYFSDRGLAEWIWTSCARHLAADDRFERPFRRSPGALVTYVENPAPEDLYGDFKVVYSTLDRLARRGYQPDFVLDVGASGGVWSDTVQRVFPLARFLLVEPLQDRYPDWYRKRHPEFEWVSAAASDKAGKTVFQVSHDLYGSSLFRPEDNREYRSVDVEVTTLDTILDQKKIGGRGIVKIDVQFAEHLVLDGAARALEQTDFLIMELTLRRCVPEAKTFVEMVNRMEAGGFEYYDDVGGWRCPVDGTLEQKDVLFARRETVRKLGI